MLFRSDEVTQKSLFHFIHKIYTAKPGRLKKEKQNDKSKAKQQKKKYMHGRRKDKKSPKGARLPPSIDLAEKVLDCEG